MRLQRGRIEDATTYLLDIVVGQRPPVLQLLPGEDQTLLVRRDALLVLDLGFDIVDGVGGFDLEGDGFPREGFDEAFSGGVCQFFFFCGLDRVCLWVEGREREGGGLHLHCD